MILFKFRNIYLANQVIFILSLQGLVTNETSFQKKWFVCWASKIDSSRDWRLKLNQQ